LSNNLGLPCPHVTTGESRGDQAGEGEEASVRGILVAASTIYDANYKIFGGKTWFKDGDRGGVYFPCEVLPLF